MEQTCRNSENVTTDVGSIFTKRGLQPCDRDRGRGGRRGERLGETERGTGIYDQQRVPRLDLKEDND